MPVQYSELEEREGGLIVNKKTGTKYTDPTHLAGEMGIKPHQIDWAKISKAAPPQQKPAREPPREPPQEPPQELAQEPVQEPVQEPTQGRGESLTYRGQTYYRNELSASAWAGLTQAAQSEQAKQAEQAEQAQLDADTQAAISNIRTMWGSDWNPSTIFTSKGLVDQGIIGAVRVQGSPDVYTIGPGGGLETPESYKDKFGTLNQEGIVGVVSEKDARNLGIKPTAGPEKPSEYSAEGTDYTVQDAEEVPRYSDIYDDSNVVSYVNKLNKLIEEQEAAAAAAKEERDKMQAEFKEKEKTWWDKLTGKPSIQEEQADLYEQTGMTPEEYFADQKAMIEEIGALQEQYNNVQGQMQQDLMASGQRMESVNFIRGEQALIERQYNSKLSNISANMNAKAGVMAAKQGAWAEARAFVNDALQAIMYDREHEFKMYQTFVNKNETWISKLDAKYQNAIDRQLEWLRQAYEVEKTERNQVMNLMVSFPNANIDPNMSVQEATWNAQQSQRTEEQKAQDKEQRNQILQMMLEYPAASINPDMGLEQAVQAVQQTYGEQEGMPETVSGGGGSRWAYNTETGQFEMAVPPIYKSTGGGGGTQGEDLGWMDFTDQEKRKLQAAGINWTTEDGFIKALEHLYPQEPEEYPAGFIGPLPEGAVREGEEEKEPTVEDLLFGGQ